MNRRNIGSLYEIGEIDIIAIKDGILRFIEVKYRRDTKYGYPAMAVSYNKKRKIEGAALWFLNVHGEYMGMQCSFDVIAIHGDSIEYIYNAFNSF